MPESKGTRVMNGSSSALPPPSRFQSSSSTRGCSRLGFTTARYWWTPSSDRGDNDTNCRASLGTFSKVVVLSKSTIVYPPRVSASFSKSASRSTSLPAATSRSILWGQRSPSPSMAYTPVVGPPSTELNCWTAGLLLRFTGATCSNRLVMGNSCTLSRLVIGSSCVKAGPGEPAAAPDRLASGGCSCDIRSRAEGSANSPGTAPSSTHSSFSLATVLSVVSAAGLSVVALFCTSSRCRRVMPGLGTGRRVSRIHCGNDKSFSSISACFFSNFRRASRK
mmetsp:Transcript_45653/g.81001  ORF Transcript_45653/g.81001 Transcript_45653/m.81001 type:complete len:278 (+) Transcript_45653:628-1461(+)